jgi:hypothetical protein
MPRCIDGVPTVLTRALLSTLFLVLVLAGCDLPEYEGPQLQEPPRGFLLQPGSEAGSIMFPHRTAVHYGAWVQSQAPYSTIRIHGYSGRLALPDVMAAQDSVRRRASDPDMTFGSIEVLTIDGREALGWEERIESATRGIPWVAYRVMIPYDTISYTIEFSTEDPIYKAGAPGSLRDVISTFAVGETVYNWPLIVIAMGLLFFTLHMLRRKSEAQHQRLQSIRLVKIEKEDEPGTEGADLASTGSTRSGGGPSAQ